MSGAASLADPAPTPTRARHLCHLADLIPGAGVAARIDGSVVAVFRIPGATPEVFALGHFDPIGGANVLARGIVGDLDGELVVASPLYKHHFSLRSGRCLEQPDVAVPVWRSLIADGEVYLVESARDGAV